MSSGKISERGDARSARLFYPGTFALRLCCLALGEMWRDMERHGETWLKGVQAWPSLVCAFVSKPSEPSAVSIEGSLMNGQAFPLSTDHWLEAYLRILHYKDVWDVQVCSFREWWNLFVAVLWSSIIAWHVRLLNSEHKDWNIVHFHTLPVFYEMIDAILCHSSIHLPEGLHTASFSKSDASSLE